jgi:pimeloyl-ACP methyl ester carboxylesterase
MARTLLVGQSVVVADPSPAVYVLVHGAWGGAHGFRHVRRALRLHGHEVFTPSLTGLGERAHLVSPQVGLTTHVQDVVNAVLYEDLREVVLVGWSYGGAVVTGAIDHIGSRVRELVYVDAFVPRDGQSVASLLGRAGPPVLDLGAVWLAPPPPDPQIDDPEEAAWWIPRRVPTPVRCFSEPVQISIPVEERDFGLSYIKATGDGRDAPGGQAWWAAADHAQASERWRYFEIDTTHLVVSNRPDELAEILLSLA